MQLTHFNIRASTKVIELNYKNINSNNVSIVANVNKCSMKIPGYLGNSSNFNIESLTKSTRIDLNENFVDHLSR